MCGTPVALKGGKELSLELVRAPVGSAFDGSLWSLVERPAMLGVFEIAIPAASLTSPKEGIDKNMHKALKAQQFARAS